MKQSTSKHGGTQQSGHPIKNRNRSDMKNRNSTTIVGRRNLAKITSLVVGVLAVVTLSSNAMAKGGDALWANPYQDIRPAQTQEAMVSAVDSAGNLIISGYQDVLKNSNDAFYTIKLSSDGMTQLWDVDAAVYSGNGEGMRWVTNIAIDASDDVIVTGFSSNGINDDIVTIKYDGATGNEEWVHIYNGASNANDYPKGLSLDGSGNIYIAGYTQSGGTNADEAVLFKLSSAGALAWSEPAVKVINVTAAGDDRFNAVKVGPSGIAVTGYTTLTARGGGADDYDYLTQLYSDNGTLLWQKTFDNGYGSDEAFYLAIDSAGNVFVSGDVLDNAGRTDINTIKYPATGATPLWSRAYSEGSPNLPSGIALDVNDDVYLLGYTFTNSGLEDFYTAKYDGSTGNVLWEEVYDSNTNHNDSATALALDMDGGLFVTGFVDKEGGDSDFLTLKYNTANGSLLWTDMHDSTEGGNQQTVGVAIGLGISADGNVYVAGWTQSMTDIDDLDYYAIKYDTGVLNRPTDLAVTNYTASSVSLTWVDNSFDSNSTSLKNEDHFCMQRCTGFACDFSTIDFTVCTILENATTYTDNSVTKDTRYSYRVYGNNSVINDPSGDTHPSNIVMALTTVINSQDPTWVYEYDNKTDDGDCLIDPTIPSCTLDDMAKAIAVGSDNNPVVTGMSASVNNQYDYYSVKFDRTDPANPLWVDDYNGPDGQGDVGTCLSVDDNGDVIVSGYSSRDSGTAAGNTNDIYTIKYASDGPDQYTGEPLWATHYNGPGNDDDRSEAVATASDGSNHIVVVGYGGNSSGNNDIYLVKYMPDFAGMGVDQKVWGIAPYDGGYNDYPTSVMFDPFGDVVVVGKSFNAVGDSDILINKYNGDNGTQVTGQNWPVVIDSGFGDDEIRDVITDESGNIYVAGFISNNLGNRDWYINKFSPTGAALWTAAKTVEGGSDLNDNAISIAIDISDGAIVIGGTVVNLTGSKDFHVARYAADGTERWNKSVDLIDTTDELVGMALSPSGEICLVGNSCKIGSVCRAGEILQGASPDVRVVKYDHLGEITDSTLYDGLYNDYATSVASNSLGECFVAGYRSTGPLANDDYDYLVFKAMGTKIQAPAPFATVPHYTSVDLSWTENDASVDGYLLYRKDGVCAVAGDTDFTGTSVVQLLFKNDNYKGLSFDDETGVNSQGDTFCYGIQSHAAGFNNSRMIEKQVTLGTAPAPSNVTVSPLNSSDLEICWTDNTSDENFFGVKRCTGAGCAVTSLSFSAPGLPSETGSTTCYIDTTACDDGSGKTFRYSVYAYKNTVGGWTSTDSSPTSDVTTPAMDAPTSLVATRVAEAEVDLQWTDNSNDETEFVIERCTGENCDTSYSEVGSVSSVLNNVLHLKMDESSWNGTANEIIDYSGNNNHGTSFYGPIPVSDSITGNSGDFDGSNDYISTALTLDQSAGSDGITMMAWVKPDNTSTGDHYVFSTEDGISGAENYNWGLLRNGANWAVSNGVSVETTGAVVSTGAWQHVAVVFTPPSGYTFYLNGTPFAKTNIGTNDTGASVTIGRQGNIAANLFNGLVDEAAVYNRPLDSNEITKLYTRGIFPESTGVKWFTDKTADYSTIYNYKVRASKDVSCGVGVATSLPSNKVQVTTTPPAPSALVASLGNPGQILLTWTPETTTHTYFKIERCNGALCTPVDFVSNTIDPSETRYIDDVFCFNPGAIVRYHIQSVGAWGDSEPGSIVEVTIPAGTAPISLSVDRVTESQVELSWDAVDSYRDGFQILRCEGTACIPSVDVAGSTTGWEIPGLVGYWQMDELGWDGTNTSNGKVKDSSLNGNHGTSMNGLTTTVQDKPELGYGAGEFDGVDDYISTDLIVDQSATSNGATFAAWVYPTLYNSTYKYVMSTAISSSGHAFGFSYANSAWYVDNGVNTRYAYTTATLNQWQHMVVVFDPSTGYRFYKNGALTKTDVYYAPTASASVAPLHIGRKGAYNGYFFAGKLDQVQVFDRPLSTEDVQLLYNSGDNSNRTITFTDNDTLTNGLGYTYKVAPHLATFCNDWDDNASSAEVSVVMPTAPAVPTLFTATAVNTSDVLLSWTGNTTSETHYRLDRCVGTSCTPTLLIGTIPAGSTSYTDTTACANTAYKYRIRAEGATGIWPTGWSDNSTVTTPDVILPVVTANVLSESEIDVSWTDPNNAEDSYQLSRCESVTPTYCNDDGNYTLINTYPASIDDAILHYRMNEASWSGSSYDIIDQSLNINNGRSNGGVNTIDSDKPGYSRSGEFDGVDDYIYTPVNIDQSAKGTGATFEAWVKPAVSPTNWQHVISTDNGGYDWSIFHVSGIWYAYNGSSTFNTGLTVDVGQWQHVAATFDPSVGVKFYKNGVAAASISTITFDTSDSPLTIGRKASSASYFFNGEIDEVLVFDRPLSQSEIEQHWNFQASTFGYADVGLTHSTEYVYKVKAIRDGACGWPVETVAHATTIAPPAPTDLNVVCDSTTCSLNWTDNNGSETGYVVSRCDGLVGSCSTVLDGTLIAGSQSYIDDTVCPDTPYTYSVHAVGSWGVTAKVDSGKTTDPIPAPPIDLTATTISEVEIELEWTYAPADEEGFVLVRCPTGGVCQDIPVSLGSTLYQDNELIPNKEYTYVVKAVKSAVCNGGWEAPSDPAQATTDIGPASLNAVTTSTTSVDLNWTDSYKTETARLIERCSGSAAQCINDGNFTQVGAVPNGVYSYSDSIDQPLNDCYNREYSYRIKAVGDGLSNAGGDIWSKKAKVNFGSFPAFSPVIITIDNSGGAYSEMNSDFSDIRFYDETAKRELPVYWLKEKVDGVSATLWLMTGANDNIYIYYGNGSASSSSSNAEAFTEVYDFAGTVLDTNKWVEIDPGNLISQNDGAIFIAEPGSGNSYQSWYQGLISTHSFARGVDNEIYIDFTVGIGAYRSAYENFAIGWGKDQEDSSNYSNMMHGLYMKGSYGNYRLYAYENGGQRTISPTRLYQSNTRYEVKIILKAAGADYFIRGGQYNNWVMVYQSSITYTGDQDLRLSFLHYATEVTIHSVNVLHADGGAVSSLGTPEIFAGVFDNTWTANPSDTASTLTDDIFLPGNLVVTSIENGAASLIWDDNNTDESGYDIERCCGVACSYSNIGTVNSDVFNFSDINVPDNQDCTYQVIAVKDAGTCSWVSSPAHSALTATPSPAPTGFGATPVNSFKIDLSWNDVVGEDVYELEVQIWNGAWMPVATLSADTITYTDTSGINPGTDYTFRIRSRKGGVWSAYAVTSITSSPYTQDDGTCLPPALP